MRYGNWGRIIDVDLTLNKISIETPDESILKKFLGGMGFNTHIIYKQADKVDALAAESIIVFSSGPLGGTAAPGSSRTELTFKSPLTGILGSSNTGGAFGASLKYSGFDSIIIKGRALKPCFLLITPEKIMIEPANNLWGKDCWETETKLRYLLKEKLFPVSSVLTIGPAGEKQVKFACTINDYYHAAGRCGAGAVLGSKNLKAIVVTGNKKVPIADESEFREAVKNANRRIKDNYICQKFSNEGSIGKSDGSFERGCLPCFNYQAGIIENWKETRGTDVIKKYIVGKEGVCLNCPINCFNAIEVTDGKYKGLKISCGTFVQPIIEFGAKCGLDYLPAIWKCKEICHRMGMDICSAAGSIAFAMELFQRGILNLGKTGGMDLTWGNETAIIDLLYQIAFRKDFGNILAEGTHLASRHIGEGSEAYVMTIKKMEMMSSDIRSGSRGWAFGSLTNPRGGDNVKSTHMSAETIPSEEIIRKLFNIEKDEFQEKFIQNIDMFEDVKQKIYGVPYRINSYSFSGKPWMTRWFEDLFSAINSIGLCIFPADKLALGPTYYALLYSAATGYSTSPQALMRTGERIFNLQRLYLKKLGITRKDDLCPRRFFEDPISNGPATGMVLDSEEIRKRLCEYYEIRGWDIETGLPTLWKLTELGLDIY